MKNFTPEQKKAIKVFMANRKRELNTVHRRYPKFKEGMSTGEYVRAYWIDNGFQEDYRFFFDTLNYLPAEVSKEEEEAIK